MKKLVLALAIASAAVGAGTVVTEGPATAAVPPSMCRPLDFSCIYRWYACGPYVYNRFTGYSCDACGWCKA